MSIETATKIGCILATILTIAAFIAIIPEKKRAQLAPFFQKLHDIFNLRSLLSEKILKVFYVFNTFTCVTSGFFLLFAKTGLWNRVSVWWIGLLVMVVGPFICRLLHEVAMVFILMMKNTNDINHKVSLICENTEYRQPEYMQPEYTVPGHMQTTETDDPEPATTQV